MPEGNPQAYAKTQSSPYQQAWDQFGAMMPPDPNTFLQLMWPFLDINTRHLVQRLLTNPAANPMQTESGPFVSMPDPQEPIGGTKAMPTLPLNGNPNWTPPPQGPQPQEPIGGMRPPPSVQPVVGPVVAPVQPRDVQFGGRTVSVDSLAPKGAPTNPVGQTSGQQRVFMKDGSQQVADLATGQGTATPTRIDTRNTQFEVDMGGGVMAYARDAEGLRRLRAASGRQ